MISCRGERVLASREPSFLAGEPAPFRLGEAMVEEKGEGVEVG